MDPIQLLQKSDEYLGEFFQGTVMGNNNFLGIQSLLTKDDLCIVGGIALILGSNA